MKRVSCGAEVVRDLKEICQPFFQRTEISFFEYARVSNKDYSFGWLSTNPERTGFCAGKSMSRPVGSMFSGAKNRALRYYFWDSGLNCVTNSIERKKLEDVLHLSGARFDVSHGFVVLESLNDFSNVYSFGASIKNEHLREFYINNLNVLENFIFYFNDRSRKLLKHAISSHDSRGEKIAVKNIENLNLGTKRFFLTSSILGNIYLTKQEVKSMLLISKGYTIKETSSILNLSTRTVESYLKSAKERLKLKTNNQLIDFFWKSALARLV